jgi:hypothetical protein
MSKCKDQLNIWTQLSNVKHTHKWEYYEAFLDKIYTLCSKHNHHVHNMWTSHLPLWNSNTMHPSLLAYIYSKCHASHPQSPYGYT